MRVWPAGIVLTVSAQSQIFDYARDTMEVMEGVKERRWEREKEEGREEILSNWMLKRKQIDMPCCDHPHAGFEEQMSYTSERKFVFCWNIDSGWRVVQEVLTDKPHLLHGQSSSSIVWYTVCSCWMDLLFCMLCFKTWDTILSTIIAYQNVV